MLGRIRRFWMPAAFTLMFLGWVVGALQLFVFSSGPLPDFADAALGGGIMFFGVLMFIAAILFTTWRAAITGKNILD